MGGGVQVRPLRRAAFRFADEGDLGLVVGPGVAALADEGDGVRGGHVHGRRHGRHRPKPAGRARQGWGDSIRRW